MVFTFNNIKYTWLYYIYQKFSATLIPAKILKFEQVPESISRKSFWC